MSDMWKDPSVDFCKISTEDHLAFLEGIVAKAANYNLIWEREQAAAAN